MNRRRPRTAISPRSHRDLTAISQRSHSDLTAISQRGCRLGFDWHLTNRTDHTNRGRHVFIGGRSIGGLYSGTPGLVELKKEGKLTDMLTQAGAL